MVIASQSMGEEGMKNMDPSIMQDQRVLECFMAYMGMDVSNMQAPPGAGT